MSARLIITLPADTDAPLRWAVCNAYGDVLSAGEGDDAPAIPSGVTVSATIAIIPAGLIHLRRLAIPARSDSAAQQAAPYAMEEHLAAPLETQSIVCGQAGADGQRWVAAMDKALSANWQARLEKAAVRPVFAVSEAMLLDPAEGELALAAGGDAVVWRYRAGARDAAGAMPEDFHPLLLPALMDTLAPETVSLAAGLGGEYHALQGLEARPAGPFDPVRAAAGADLAALAALPPVFGARLAASLDWAALLRPWRRVAVLAGLAACLGLAAIAMEAAWLSGEARRYEAAAHDAFAAAFPDIRRIVNPRVQLAQRLREVETVEGGGDGFLQLAGALAGVTGTLDGIEIVAVRYAAADAALSVSARYDDFADFEALRSAGEAAGLEISDAGARQSAGAVTGEFVVRWR